LIVAYHDIGQKEAGWPGTWCRT